MAGEVDLVLALGDSRTRLSGNFLFPRGGERITARGHFVGLQSEALIPLLPRLAPLAGLNMAFDGALRAALSVDGRVESLDFEIAGVNGRLDAPDTFSDPLELRRIALRGQAFGADHRIDIETLSVQLGTAERPGPELSASASLAATGPGFGGDLSVGAEAVLTGLEISELDRYWPVSLEPGREWAVENIVRGHLDELRVQAALNFPGGRMEQAEVRRLDGTMSYRDLTVHYWRPMPPATGVSGTAVFDQKVITFSPRGRARVQDLQVNSGVIKIDGLDTDKETVKVDLDIGGPLRNGLELLDHDLLRLTRDLGIDPDDAEGRFTSKLKLHIPISVQTTLDNIGIWAKAELEQATIRQFLFGQDATEGRLAVIVDRSSMEVRGPLRFGGVPVEITWNENFAEDAAIRSQLEARIPEIDDAGRKVLGLDFSPFLKGPVAVDLSYSSDRDKIGRLHASVDLQAAVMSLPQLYWSKATGVHGSAELTLGLSALKLTGIEKIDVTAGTLRGSGTGRFDDSGTKLSSLAFDDLAFGGTRGRKGWQRIAVDALLPRHLWSPEPPPVTRRKLRMRGTESLDDELPEVVGAPSPDEEVQNPPSEPKPRMLRIDYGPKEGENFGFVFESNDMGAALRALDMFDTIQGGRVAVVGTSAGPVPNAPLAARIEARDYILVHAPAMVSLLTVASLAGINDTMKGEGIRFSRLIGAFTLTDGIMETDLLRAFGSAIGLTARGKIDFDESQVDFEGTVVPAYSFNQVLSSIPMLGPILTGREGEGLFAMTYRITGKLDDPIVDANPLSALAPGFLARPVQWWRRRRRQRHPERPARTDRTLNRAHQGVALLSSRELDQAVLI